ncbi:uncharacterized protein LOC110690168 [Chenopodium quinoa]|uniref:uncharacterized protein LOC110690168 n=1 Tax=Chenopodium quinoa TaxID=63459 RepID=UPI000B7909FC|nr:uncharacterized protein LOC110690168 [Chenopodium quinoa]
MANKLKPFLNNIISVNQSAFIPKRLITDNALVAFEIFHAMKRKGEGKSGSIAMKLDMSKAYDRVEWVFLERVMYKMGFCENWVRRIMDCLSSVSFSFKVNGRISGSVTPTQGLRQGDPISPYLFLIVADAFSTLLLKAAKDNLLHGARVCRGAPRISHLFFADDSIIFAKASVSDCSVIANIISIYERASGQKVNLNKTDVVFSKCVDGDRRQENEEIVNILGVQEVEQHEKYLGLPTIVLRATFSDADCKKILQLPTPIFSQEDNLFWWPSKLGEYSVKTGYWLGKLGQQAVQNAMNQEEEKRVWKIVWSPDRQPKLNHFLWRACRGSLGVKENLFRRHIVRDDLCCCCGIEVESISHVLFECHSATRAWSGSDFGPLIADAPKVSFKQTLLLLDSKIDKKKLGKILAIGWAVWFCRNKWVFDKINLDVNYIAISFVKQAEEYSNYACRVFPSGGNSKPISAASWVCPPENVLKINVNAHIAAAGYVGLGAVVRDHNGALILVAARKFEGVWDVEQAEAAAIRYGLQVANRFGYDNIWVESDSWAAIERVNKQHHGFSPLCLVYNDIFQLASNFSSLFTSHVKRTGNSIAHLVARWDTRDNVERVCMSPFPQSLIALAECDFL